MAIEKKTIIDQIEIARDGTVQIRFALLLLEDGVEVHSTWHRSSVPPGANPQLVLDAVNADIQTRLSLRTAPIDGEKVSLLKDVCQLVHTPEVMAAYHQAVLDAEEKMGATE
jgi:hypothetical protein